MQHTVEGCVGTVVTFDMVVFLAPAQLHIIENAGGDNQFLLFDLGKLAASDML